MVVQGGVQVALWRRAAEQRPLDTAGVEAGVADAVSRRLLAELPPAHAGLLRSILAGAQWPRERRCKAGYLLEPTCA
eukprot:2414211-Alexandrium_andersonii.AAC.1